MQLLWEGAACIPFLQQPTQIIGIFIYITFMWFPGVRTFHSDTATYDTCEEEDGRPSPSSASFWNKLRIRHRSTSSLFPAGGMWNVCQNGSSGDGVREVLKLLRILDFMYLFLYWDIKCSIAKCLLPTCFAKIITICNICDMLLR